MEQQSTAPGDLSAADAPIRVDIPPDYGQGSDTGAAHDAAPAPPTTDLATAEHGDAAGAPIEGTEPALAPPSLRRGLIYLLICLAFTSALLAPNLLGMGSSSSSALAPCGEGAVLAQVLAADGPAGGAPYLLAVVRPQRFPNVMPGDEPGCEELYRSDDGGITWTISFSATAEAPSAVAMAPSSDRVYLLTQRVQFPTYVAGNVYRSDGQAVAWTWDRVSPQGRRDVPAVSATDMLLTDDGSIILREGNGDGAALVISRDGGSTWQPLIIPRLQSVGSVATLRNQIAVTAPLLLPGQPPGMTSDDHGASWQPMGALPDAPMSADLRPLLSADGPEGALVLDLVPAGALGSTGTVARYTSLDGGRRWTRVHCGAQPAPGCAVAARWAQAAGVRYVLYHGQVYRAPADRPWTPLPAPLPVPSGQVLQVVAATRNGRPLLYLASATGIWRWDGAAWRPASPGLPLGAPPPTLS